VKTQERVEDAAVAILLILKPLGKRERGEALDLARKAATELLVEAR
jgi:indole-3-glycerol phosphate synthase